VGEVAGEPVEFALEDEQQRGEHRDGDALEDVAVGDERPDAVGDEHRDGRRQREPLRLSMRPLDAEEDAEDDDE